MSPEPNVELLDRVLDIVFHPEEMPENLRWYQGDWLRRDWSPDGRPQMCGTAMCFAGWALWAEGYTEYLPRPSAGLRNPDTGEFIDYYGIRNAARDRLGLTEAQADDLFHSDNNLHDLAEVVKLIKQGTHRNPWWDMDDDDDDLDDDTVVVVSTEVDA